MILIKNLFLLFLIRVNYFFNHFDYFSQDKINTTKIENEILNKLKVSGYCVINDFIDIKECQKIKKKNRFIYKKIS